MCLLKNLLIKEMLLRGTAGVALTLAPAAPPFPAISKQLSAIDGIGFLLGSLGVHLFVSLPSI